MKHHTFIVFVLLLVSPSVSGAEDFLGAPVIPGGTIIRKTDARLEFNAELSHDETVTYYRSSLKDETDIKFREWKDATYIEDDGRRSWHSITISKNHQDGTIVAIVKDSWTWIIGTLILRYIGVFVVLLILFLGMSVSGTIISRFIKKRAEE